MNDLEWREWLVYTQKLFPKLTDWFKTPQGESSKEIWDERLRPIQFNLLRSATDALFESGKRVFPDSMLQALLSKAKSIGGSSAKVDFCRFCSNDRMKEVYVFSVDCRDLHDRYWRVYSEGSLRMTCAVRCKCNKSQKGIEYVDSMILARAPRSLTDEQLVEMETRMQRAAERFAGIY